MTTAETLLLVSFMFHVSTIFGLSWLWTEIKAMQKSTHSVTYIDPLSPSQSFQKLTEEEEDKLNKDQFENIM